MTKTTPQRILNSLSDAFPHDSDLKRLKAACRLSAFALGLLQLCGNLQRNLLSGDATSYLDIADAYGRGDFSAAVNAFWSPLYSWLLELFLLVFEPSPRSELTIVGLANLFIYLSALAAFDFFLREWIRFQNERAEATGEPTPEGDSTRATLPAWTWYVFGYSLFIWSSLELNFVARITPDMLVSALVYAASALLVRMRRRQTNWSLYLLFGLLLGLGYLAKTAMFPLGFVFLTSALVAGRGGFRRAAPRVAVAIVAFLCVAAPFIYALSESKGRFTFGESGRLNYCWHVNRVGQFINWQGDSDVRLAHPTRKIFDEPAVYEFGAPVEASYPPWYDPSYWNEGLAPRFDLRRQTDAIIENVGYFLKQYSYKSFPNGIAVVMLFLLYLSRSRLAVLKGLVAHLFVLLPALAAFVMYLLIHVEGRYVAAFAVLLCVSLLASVPLEASARRGASLPLAAFFMLTALVLSIGASFFHSLSNTLRRTPNEQVQVAEGLRALGLLEGERVGSIGDAIYSSWPRLARLRVVAEIPYVVKGVQDEPTGEVEKFWSADDATKARVVEAFKETGARAIVARRIPLGASTTGWHRIGETKHYVYFIR
ncbi:MAG TPA: hypothetical protein VGB73_15165 [Pyrinomonadaceae bacterium]